jgi:hypothetical protein
MDLRGIGCDGVYYMHWLGIKPDYGLLQASAPNQSL